MKNNEALLIIDMQNVYLPENQWACIRMDEIIKYIDDKINRFPKKSVFFTRHMAFNNPKGVWKTYNATYAEINSNDYLNDFVSELKKYISDDNVFVKNGFSALSNISLLEKLDKFDTIYITGVVAECCVLSTIFSLIDMGKKIIYCNNGIAGQSQEKEKAVIEILKELSPLHIVFEDSNG